MREVQRHDGSVALYDDDDDQDLVMIEPIIPAAHALLALRRHHNRAEASLIALYGAVR